MAVIDVPKLQELATPGGMLYEIDCSGRAPLMANYILEPAAKLYFTYDFSVPLPEEPGSGFFSATVVPSTGIWTYTMDVDPFVFNKQHLFMIWFDYTSTSGPTQRLFTSPFVPYGTHIWRDLLAQLGANAKMTATSKRSQKSSRGKTK
ncbi:MAG: hypothetical protein IAF94_05375 [Pirellulaceae bacterium]|nr:hypothetical protein [Pirellulaceae bacterium]